MGYEGCGIDLTKYRQDDIFSESKGIYEYDAINPENLQIRKNHNVFYLKMSKWNPYQHWGEYLGYRIASRIGFKTCEAQIYKRPRFGNPDIDDIGVISFVEKAEEMSTNVEFISTEKDEGMQLYRAFDGIAAILRYHVEY